MSMHLVVAIVAGVLAVPVLGIAAFSFRRMRRRRARFDPSLDPGERFIDDEDRALLKALLACAPGNGAISEGDAEKACDEGDRALAAWLGSPEPLKLAAHAYGQALGFDPKLARAWVGLAEACMNACFSHTDAFGEVYWRGGLAQAERLVDRALELDPPNDDAIALKASFRRRLGYVAEAEERLAGADPHHWRVAWVRAGTHADRDRYDLWVADLAKATETAPRARQAQLFNALGSAFTKVLEFSKAVESFDHALTLQPDYAWAWHNRAVALMRAGKKPEALESSNKALALGEFSAARQLNDRLKR